MTLPKILFVPIVVICGLSTSLKAQVTQKEFIAVAKRPVDTSDFGLSKDGSLICKVSQNGGYCFSYTYENRLSKLTTLFVEAIKTHKKSQIPGINKMISPEFLNDGRQIAFVLGKDSLSIFDMGDGSQRYVNQVASFVTGRNGDDQYLAYICDLPGKMLHILDMRSGKEIVLSDAASFELIDCGNAIWLSYKSASDPMQLHLLNLKNTTSFDFADVSSSIRSPDSKVILIGINDKQLIWLDLATSDKQLFFNGGTIAGYAFDKSGQQLAFTTDQSESSAIWYFKEGMAQAEDISINSGISDKVGQLSFNKYGDQLVLSASAKPLSANKNVAASNVKVWNYQDQQLPLTSSSTEQFWLTIDLSTKKTVKLDPAGGELELNKNYGHYLLSMTSKAIDYYYNKAHGGSATLLDITNGTKNLIAAHIDVINVSPEEKFVTWFDLDSLNWFSFETSTHIKRNISKSIPFPMYDKYPIELGRINAGRFGLAAWAKYDRRLYLYDQYDVWEVDPAGAVPPLCITKGLGRKERTTLTLSDFDEKRQEIQVVSPGEQLVIAAFDTKTKDCGFWMLKLGSGRAPSKGLMLPFALGESRSERTTDNAHPPRGTIKKIGNTGMYLVTRQSAEQFPNNFLTDDFKHYRQLTNFQPQFNYNWLTAELVNWKLPNGSTAQGILYKPENFDPSKRYPLIFDYYQGRSDEFHSFQEADYSCCRINIPYFVSNGYLIFVPDIFNKKGQNSQSVVDAVVSAAHYLTNRPYVDSAKLGLQGHSLGGWETNILVTHTKNIFAAACEAAGMSDFISWYDEIPYPGQNQSMLEAVGQLSPYGIGVTPWTSLEVYAKDSPVLFADQVTTPLLMVHSDKDGATPYAQGIEMYMALKRAGKKTWLLEYPDGGHGLNGNDAKDYTIRMKQFFDYYLKGSPPPKWMTHPINAAGYQEQVGYELDQSSIQP